MYTHIKSIILLNGDLYNTLYHMNPKQIIVSLLFQRTNKLTSMLSYVNFQADVLDKVVIHLVLVFFQKCENKQSFCLRPPTGLYIIYCLLLCLFSNRPQETSKSEVKISFVLQKFHVICDLLLIRCTPT